MLQATHFRGKPMSQFQEKVFAACAKKEALFDESLGRYALRSILAGAYLTMSTAVGIIGADVIATGIPALSRFVFALSLIHICVATTTSKSSHPPLILATSSSSPTKSAPAALASSALAPRANTRDVYKRQLVVHGLT